MAKRALLWRARRGSSRENVAVRESVGEPDGEQAFGRVEHQRSGSPREWPGGAEYVRGANVAGPGLTNVRPGFLV